MIKSIWRLSLLLFFSFHMFAKYLGKIPRLGCAHIFLSFWHLSRLAFSFIFLSFSLSICLTKREREREMCDSHKRFIYLFCSMAIGIQTSWLVFCLLSIPLKKLTNVKRKKMFFCIYVVMYECVCVCVCAFVCLSFF